MRKKILASVGIISLLVLAAPATASAVPLTAVDDPGGPIAVDFASVGGIDSISRGFVLTDLGQVTGVTLAVSFSSSRSDNCDAALDWSQRYSDELGLTLVSPAGTQIPLVAFGTYNSGAPTDEPVSVLFSEAASDLVGSTNQGYPEGGVFQPVTPLAALNGEPAAGTWALQVDDADAGAAQCYFGALLTVETTSAATTTAISASGLAVKVGDSVTLSSTVGYSLDGFVPTGSVEYFTGTTSLGVSPLVDGVVAGNPVSFATAGSFPVVAVYSGDANFAGSTSAQIVVVVTGATQPKAPQRVDTGL